MIRDWIAKLTSLATISRVLKSSFAKQCMCISTTHNARACGQQSLPSLFLFHPVHHAGHPFTVWSQQSGEVAVLPAQWSNRQHSFRQHSFLLLRMPLTFTACREQNWPATLSTKLLLLFTVPATLRAEHSNTPLSDDDTSLIRSRFLWIRSRPSTPALDSSLNTTSSPTTCLLCILVHSP